MGLVLMSDNIPAEQVLFTNYIKYNRLSQMVEETFKGSSAESVNIFIDIYSMIRNVYSNESFFNDDKLLLSSSLINLCAHIRHFFRNRYRVETKIFLVYSNNIPEYNKKIWFGYNSMHEAVLKATSTAKLTNYDHPIIASINALETITPYLPDIYFVKTDFESGLKIYDIICRNEADGNTDPNIIFSTDPYLYQLVTMANQTYIFRPKKYQSKDLSYVVSSENLLKVLFEIRKVKIDPKIFSLNAGIYSLLLTLSRCPERSIKAFLNLPTASEIIYSGVSGHRILNGYNSNTQLIWNSLDRSSFDNKYSYDLFERRFKVIDLLSQYFVFMNTNHEDLKLINKIDSDTVREINNTYYKKYPLDLNRL